jgi:uncharacterized MnhB-related membrane protein
MAEAPPVSLIIRGRTLLSFAWRQTWNFSKDTIGRNLTLIILTAIASIILGLTQSGLLSIVGAIAPIVITIILVFGYYLIKAPLVALAETQTTVRELTNRFNAERPLPELDVTIHEALIELHPRKNWSGWSQEDRESINCFIEATIHNKSDVETNVRRYHLYALIDQRAYRHVVPIKQLDHFYLSIVTEDFSARYPEEPEQRELDKFELENLGAKIAENVTLTKTSSKTGWLGFTVYDLNLPFETQTKDYAYQNEEGEYVADERDEAIGIRTDLISELVLTVVDGYGREKAISVRAPFTKYGKRIRLKSKS